jgi:hypothetical protein
VTIAQTDKPTPPKAVRLWPGAVAVVLQWLVRFGAPIVVPGAFYFGVFGGVDGFGWLKAATARASRSNRCRPQGCRPPRRA